MTLTEFLERNKEKGPARFYMPGHKGKFPLDGAYDITEITGADSLYHADGIIRETERRFERLYGSKATVLSARRHYPLHSGNACRSEEKVRTAKDSRRP